MMQHCPVKMSVLFQNHEVLKTSSERINKSDYLLFLVGLECLEQAQFTMWQHWGLLCQISVLIEIFHPDSSSWSSAGTAKCWGWFQEKSSLRTAPIVPGIQNVQNFNQTTNNKLQTSSLFIIKQLQPDSLISHGGETALATMGALFVQRNGGVLGILDLGIDI